MADFKKFRTVNKMTQEVAAEFFGCSQGFISQIEKGIRPIPEEFISKSLAKSGIDAAWLQTDENEVYRTNNPNMISIPADVWDVIKNQAASLKSKDEQTFEALRQSAEMLEMLKEQNKKTNAPQAVTAKCADAV